MMAEAGAGAEHPSVSLHSLPCESHCFGDTVTSYSEDSAALMDMCVKSEPEDEHISHPEYCTEVQEMGSGLHLDTEHIKSEIVTVKIMEDSTDLQYRTTEGFCPPSEHLHSSTFVSSQQYKSDREEVKTEQHFSRTEITVSGAESHHVKEEYENFPTPVYGKYKSDRESINAEHYSLLQRTSRIDTAVNEFESHSIKEEHVDVQVNGLISIPCSLSMQYKSETGIVKVEQHSQLESPSSPEFTVNDSAHDLLHNNSVKMGSSLIRVGHDVQAIGALEQSVGSSTSGLPNKASKWKCNDGFILSAQKLQCLQCRKVFKSQSHLEKHLEIHSGGKHYCMQCESSFSPTCQLKHHQFLPSPLKRSTRTKYENILTQVAKKLKQQHWGCYKCNHCGKNFSQAAYLKQHQVVHSGEKPYKCSQCGKSFSRRGHLKQHQLVHSGEKPFKCSDCGKGFSLTCHLKEHQLVHSGEKPYKCSECGKSFSQGGTLKRHQLLHSGEKPFKCSDCGKGFSLICHLKEHQLAHSGEKPFKCCECGKSFFRTGQLKQHQLVHSGEKPYKCSECGKTFSVGSNLKKHQRVHSGEKPYICSECGKNFSQYDHLKRHQLIHTGEKPYKCSQCGKCFSRSGNLKQHQSIHTGEKPYKCGECGKRFSRASHLKQHLRVHTGEKPYAFNQQEQFRSI
uniref:C2H2-type domain-containing protein n=1 Tax=Scleropages formosus TaxID=113540 RepID=A0A8C9TGF1_SCLFO